MTRVLVCGPAVFDDPLFVHSSLNEVNSIYGPVSCIIHNNHLSAMLWQQWVARRQDTRHLPIVLDPRDGTAKHTRCRDRMFEQGRPEFVVVFEQVDKEEPGRDELSRHVIHRALDRGLPLATYTYMGGLRVPKAVMLEVRA